MLELKKELETETQEKYEVKPRVKMLLGMRGLMKMAILWIL